MSPTEPATNADDGWERQGVTIPRNVWLSLRALAGRRGHGSMKIITTAALGVMAGMPEHVRDRLMRWINATEWDHGPEALTPEAIWGEFVKALREDHGNAQVIGPVESVPPAAPRGELPLPTPATHQVTRILDPEILKRKKGGAA